MALRAGLRADHGEAPVGVHRERGPDLLPVDPPAVAVEARPGADRGEVGAGARLRVALAPQLLAAQDRRQEALALGVGAEGGDGRREQVLAHVVDAGGRPGARVLLGPDHLAVEPGAAAAVLGRQVEADPAALPQLPLPGEAHLEALVLAAGTAGAAQLGELAAQVLAEPVANLGAEGFVGGGRSQVHGQNIPSACLGSQLRSGRWRRRADAEDDAIPFHPPDVARYRAAGEWGDETLSDLVARNARRRRRAGPDRRPRLAHLGRIRRARDALAGLLAGAGFEPGAPLAVLLPDGPSVHVAYLACERAGHPIVAIAARSGIREIAHVLRRTGAAAVITHDTFGRAPVAELHAGLRDEGLDAVRRLVLPDLAVDGLAGATLDGAAPPPPATPAAPLDPDGLYLINSTSGTTGLPKCVVHNQNRWFSFARMAIDAGEFGAEEVVLSAVPSPYGFGLWSAHFVPALLGCPVVLMERFEVERMLELLERHRVTFLACVTTQMMMMLGSPTFAERDLGPLRTVFTGGEAVSAEAAARFEATTGAHVLQFYGSNENGAISVTSHGDADEQRLGTAGRPIAAMNVRLYDGETDVTASGGPGQVATRGPTGCLGYYGDAEANAELLNDDGWMLSGDLPTIGADGFLRLTGRASDLIIRGGKNISAVAVEAEASSHPAIALAAAIAAPDPVFGEKVCLCVELVPGEALTLEDLRAHMPARGVSREWLPERLRWSTRCPARRAKRSTRPSCAAATLDKPVLVSTIGACRPREHRRTPAAYVSRPGRRRRASSTGSPSCSPATR